jgi:hypothetical protein
VTLPGAVTVTVATVAAVTWTLKVLAAAAGRLAPSSKLAAPRVARRLLRMVVFLRGGEWSSRS